MAELPAVQLTQPPMLIQLRSRNSIWTTCGVRRGPGGDSHRCVLALAFHWRHGVVEIEMPSKDRAKVMADVSRLVDGILADKERLNDIVDLLNNLQDTNVDDEKRIGKRKKVDKPLRSASVRGLAEVFKKLIERGDLEDEEAPQSSSTAAVRSWLTELLDTFWSILLRLLASADKTINDIALVSCFQIIRALHDRRIGQGQDPREIDHWSGVEATKLKSILPALCSSTGCKRDRIKRFKEYLEYLDVQQHVIQGLAKFTKKATKPPTITECLKSNILCFLETIKFRKPSAKDMQNPRTLLCHNEAGESVYKYDHEAVRRAFSDLWESFLKVTMNHQLYKRVMVILNDDVIQHLSRPLLLTDFLINSYRIGGAISILALSGVFTLVQKYNLEYPDFYDKLYALLQPDLLSAKYRARFFYLADIFMTSSHLPEYLVAAFVKRLSRLALTAPMDAIPLLLAFIGNLLMRHRGLVKMIRCKAIQGDDELAGDPFKPDETDTSKCDAINSKLWEIATLQTHVSPQVSQAATKLVTKSLPQEEWDLSQYLELSAKEMMDIETKKKVFVNVPVTFERPKGLKFPKNDLTSAFFN